MKRLPLLTGIAPLLVLAAACSDSPTSIDTADGTALETARPDITPVITPLSNEETLDLLHMREEEKLARDVYDLLYDEWGVAVHDQISNSEQRHMDTMLQMVDVYGLEDPVGDNPAGVFTDSGLQDLYDQLVALGTTSAQDALIVGCIIEEVDILDLEEVLVRSDHDNLDSAYSSLMRGSENHLRSFVATLESMFGVVYEPQYLTLDRYEDILDADGTPGGYGNGGSGGNDNGGNGGNGGNGDNGGGNGNGGDNGGGSGGSGGSHGSNGGNGLMDGSC
ncbi:MAG: DUF2202 domain-containing protein [Candidatus Eisenbacteria bacterium]